MSKKRGLGKPLHALLSYPNANTVVTLEEVKGLMQAQETLKRLPLTLLDRGEYQPRRDFQDDSLAELAASIQSQGIIQPILVRPKGDRYEIIAGERRCRAARIAGLTEVPAIIRAIPDEVTVAVALIENIQRENLHPIEEALAFERLMNEFGLTHQQIADKVGKSRASISNLLRLLALPPAIREIFEQGKLEMGHARALLALPEALMQEAANMIIERHLSVREAEVLVQKLQNNTVNSVKKAQSAFVNELDEYANILSASLQLNVKIACNAKGRGKLVIRYKSLAELKGVVAQFKN